MMRGRTAKILSLLEQGKTYAEISRELGCSKPNVAQTVKRYQGWNRIVAPMPITHHDWIVKKASRAKMLPSVYVANLLVELIDKELESE